MDLVSLLVLVLVLALVWWVIQSLGLPQPVIMVLAVLMALILIGWLFGGLPRIGVR